MKKEKEKRGKRKEKKKGSIPQKRERALLIIQELRVKSRGQIILIMLAKKSVTAERHMIIV